ncbi:hypothetical protein ABNQ39_06810 [Azospirillum sp. A26]|uniref:hypothetical protein n=1 Tax=Azospirillum sp. A26 TaxID=3160607 RepID=UPI00366DAABF
MLKKLKEEVKSPLTFSGWLIGLAGLAWGFYSWAVPNQSAEISYRIEQVQMLNADSGDHSAKNTGENGKPFRVLGKDGEEITKNIYGANISVWNSGNVDLGPEKVRRTLSIDVGESAKIINASLDYSTENNVSEFYIAGVSRNIPINWRFFDPNSGFRLRVIYSSEEKSEIKVEGNILGAKIIHKDGQIVDGNSTLSIIAQVSKYLAYAVNSIFVFFLVLGLLRFLVTNRKNLANASYLKESLFGFVVFLNDIKYVAIIFSIVFICMYYFVKSQQQNVSPPF